MNKRKKECKEVRRRKRQKNEDEGQLQEVNWGEARKKRGVRGETLDFWGINLNMALIRGRGGRRGGGSQRRPRARQLTAKNEWSRRRKMVVWTSNMASGVARQEGNCSAMYIWHHMHVRRSFCRNCFLQPSADSSPANIRNQTDNETMRSLNI